MDNVESIDIFIKSFVLKDRRDRAEHELKNKEKRGRFTNRLNHTWANVLNMQHITKIPDSQDDFDFAKKELKITNTGNVLHNFEL